MKIIECKYSPQFSMNIRNTIVFNISNRHIIAFSRGFFDSLTAVKGLRASTVVGGGITEMKKGSFQQVPTTSTRFLVLPPEFQRMKSKIGVNNWEDAIHSKKK